MKCASPPKLTLSIVSHGQGALVRNLFADLNSLSLANIEIVLTLNIPEDESWLKESDHLPIRMIRNTVPLGFGSNHNQALSQSLSEFFVVVNPDIRLSDSSFLNLAQAFADDRVAASAPLVLSPDGVVQDNVRRFPTVARLARRVFQRPRKPDYPAMVSDVDWAAGMLVMFRREALAAIGGFDERYFMYLEDADICRRLWQEGWKVRYQPTCSVVHDARRASHRSLDHLRWHVRSTVRFLTGF